MGVLEALDVSLKIKAKQCLYLVKLDYSLSFALRSKLSHITHYVSVNMNWLR